MFSVFTEMGRAEVIFFFPAQLVVVIVVQKTGISMWHQISGIILFINCKYIVFMKKKSDVSASDVPILNYNQSLFCQTTARDFL